MSAQPILPFDRERLDRQLDLVRELMADGKWRTLQNIVVSLSVVKMVSEAGVSARLRDLRKEGLTVERRRVSEKSNQYEYRCL